MRGATLLQDTHKVVVQISIHAPHARSDVLDRSLTAAIRIYFNPRSSCEERRRSRGRGYSSCHFNPRSSCEERRIKRCHDTSCAYFNPRSSCEERHKHIELRVNTYRFQSTLLMRGATHEKYSASLIIPFQSTLLMRGATPIPRKLMPWYEISIHAPHARSDDELVVDGDGLALISIHAPHARSDDLLQHIADIAFLISIHAPHARSDLQCYYIIFLTADFNPRSSCEERRSPAGFGLMIVKISIHAPHARSDLLYPLSVCDF